MEKNIKRLLLLASLVLVVVPMVIFPSRLGLPLLTASSINMLYEVIFYGIVLYFFNRQVSLMTLLMGAALTLVFRMTLGAVFGTTIIFMYGLDSSIAFSLGMTRYLPALILHIGAAPFIMKPVYENLADNFSGEKRPHRPQQVAQDKIIGQPQGLELNATTAPTPAQQVVYEEIAAAPSTNFYHEAQAGSSDEANILDKAVTYIGEAGAIKMALLVDDEGLTLARFNRSEEDYELWAPLAMILEQDNRTIINKYSRMGIPKRIDITTHQNRLIFRRIDHVTLMVMADETIDETIHIRIAQATDMIRKYMSERYSPALFARAEERYVSNS